MSLITPVSIGRNIEIHAANLSALKGWEDIVEPLLKALHEPQAPTDALTVIHRLQRLAVIAEMGLGGYETCTNNSVTIRCRSGRISRHCLRRRYKSSASAIYCTTAIR
jgi:hypothetical protein